MRRREAVWFFVCSFAIAGVISAPAATAQMPVGGWTSPNVEWLGNKMLSRTPGAISGFVHEGYFYAEGLDGIEIFDVSDAAAPALVSRIPLPGPFPAPFQNVRYDIDVSQPDTNGEILIAGAPGWTISGYTENLHGLLVYDVRDKSSPVLLSIVPTQLLSFECVLDCRWVYGSGGEVIDLRDPSKPSVAGRWDRDLDIKSVDPLLQEDPVDTLVEVSPGRILVASTPMYFLDARRNPVRPSVLARSDASPYTLGGVAWPAGGRSDVAFSFSEYVLPPRCEAQDALRGSTYDSAVKSWDTSDWKRSGLITGLHEYRLSNGTYSDGDPAVSGLQPDFWGCGPGAIDSHPRFTRTSLVAMAASGHGMKVLHVDDSGRMEEAGWFLPYEGEVVLGAYWITDEIVYTVGYPRGIDILRFDPAA